MNGLNHQDARISELQTRIAEKERKVVPISGETPRSKFCTKAGKKIDIAYVTLCDRVPAGIIFGLKFGTHTAAGARNLHKTMKAYGKMRLILNLGDRPDGAFDVARFPAATGEGYDRFVLPLLAQGLNGLDPLLAKQQRKWECSSVVESALAEANTELMPLMREFLR